MKYRVQCVFINTTITKNKLNIVKTQLTVCLNYFVNMSNFETFGDLCRYLIRNGQFPKLQSWSFITESGAFSIVLSIWVMTVK